MSARTAVRIESDLVRVRDLRKERRAARLALVWLWMVGLGVMAMTFENPHVADLAYCWTPLVLLAGTSLLLGLRRGAALAGAVTGAKRSPGSVVIDDGIVQVGDRGALLEIVSGWTEPAVSASGEAVVLVTRGEIEARFALPRLGMGADVLRAAGVASEQRAVKLRLGPGDSGAVRAVMIFGAAGAAMTCLYFSVFAGAVLRDVLARPGAREPGEMAMLAVAAFAALFSGWWARRLGSRLLTTTLTIGSDGVVVHRLGFPRLLRRVQIEEVVAEDGAVLFRLRGAKPVRVPASSAATIAAVDRIEEALAAMPVGGAPFERLDRAGRSIRDWIGDLRALGKAPRGYRVATLDPQDLFALVKDGAAPVERRIAAAAALAGCDDQEARDALRVAADTCVDPPLRVVLDRAAEGEVVEHELEQALGAARRRR